MSKPRGGKKKFGHKGGSRHFTDFEELKAQQEEIRRMKSGIVEEGDEGAGTKLAMDSASRDVAGSDASTSSDEEDDDGSKHKGVQHLIEIENPNRVKQKLKKVTEVNVNLDESQLSRKEREAIEKQRARENYLRLHAEGKTDEARADLARLAIVRKQREEAAKQREQQHQKGMLNQTLRVLAP
ncbi:unnamed protein product [Soboliphyme baturini]|uniref:PP28 domain-containing protein n=1 Tax=Soboliphyme baturini TaxID=241478 RepID=A0A183IJZ0_9BILA|nr:unnamed protein product [Soboliphyme baturini]